MASVDLSCCLESSFKQWITCIINLFSSCIYIIYTFFTVNTLDWLHFASYVFPLQDFKIIVEIVVLQLWRRYFHFIGHIDLFLSLIGWLLGTPFLCDALQWELLSSENLLQTYSTNKEIPNASQKGIIRRWWKKPF